MLASLPLWLVVPFPREAVLTETNAIGTTALGARLLPTPLDAEALKLLRSYVQLRILTGRAQASCGPT